jgi:hypothetical protein
LGPPATTGCRCQRPLGEGEDRGKYARDLTPTPAPAAPCPEVATRSALVSRPSRRLRAVAPGADGFGRVISVSILCLAACSTQLVYHNRAKSLNPFFARSLTGILRTRISVIYATIVNTLSRKGQEMPGHAQLSTKNTNLDMDINCKSRPLPFGQGVNTLTLLNQLVVYCTKELALLRKILRDSYCRRVGEVAEHIAIALLWPG